MLQESIRSLQVPKFARNYILCKSVRMYVCTRPKVPTYPPNRYPRSHLASQNSQLTSTPSAASSMPCHALAPARFYLRQARRTPYNYTPLHPFTPLSPAPTRSWARVPSRHMSRNMPSLRRLHGSVVADTNLYLLLIQRRNTGEASGR